MASMQQPMKYDGSPISSLQPMKYDGPEHYVQSQGPFPPLKAVREGLNLRWYRCPTPRGALTRLAQRSDAQGLFMAVGHLSIWLATFAFALTCWRGGHAALTALAVVLHGTVGSTMVYGCHEMGHGTVFRTKRLNDGFLALYSLLFWWDPVEYATSHTQHHRYTQYPEADRENVPPIVPGLEFWPLLQLFTLNLTLRPDRVFGKGGALSCVELTVRAALGGVAADAGTKQHEWLSALHADQPEQAAKSMRWNRVLLAFHAAVLGASVYAREPAVFLLTSCHSFFGNWLSYFVGGTQHCGLAGSVPDFRQNTRSVALPAFVEFLFWHMNWHMEHHMFAAIPCYNLRKIRDLVASDCPAPRTLVGAWREMRHIHAMQLADPAFVYKVPLPATAGAGGAARCNADGTRRAADDAAESIGDLAPADGPEARARKKGA
jgi:fatty acid desaturase